MASFSSQRTPWAIARAQHEVITGEQLAALGYSRSAIAHRVRIGRLFRVHHGVFAVGHPNLTQKGRWMAAVLACGDAAALSHDDAAALWRIGPDPTDPIHVSVLGRRRSRDGIEVHTRKALNATTRNHIPVTTPAQTLIDVAHRWPTSKLEQAIGEADLRRIVGLRALRTAAIKAGRSGAPLRAVIERLTFRVTQSELERAFLRIVRRSGLPLPETQARFGTTRVDFHWPAIGLVVETDGGSFHRTAVQQLADRRRDQEHIRAGRIVLRLMHAQVFLEPDRTATLLADVFTECQCRRGSRSTKRAA